MSKFENFLGIFVELRRIASRKNPKKAPIPGRCIRNENHLVLIVDENEMQ